MVCRGFQLSQICGHRFDSGTRLPKQILEHRMDISVNPEIRVTIVRQVTYKAS